MMSAPLARAASTKAFTFGTESAQRLRRSIVQVCTVKSITRSAVSFGTSVTGLSCGGVGSFAAYQSSMMVAPRAAPTVSAAAVTAIAAMENTLPGMASSLLFQAEAYVIVGVDTSRTTIRRCQPSEQGHAVAALQRRKGR